MIDKKISYVLSTGRTGTVSIANLLNAADNVKAIHEPKPSRRFYTLGRFYLEGRFDKQKLAKYYYKTRKPRVKNISEEHYIEVDPHLWALGGIFCENQENPCILHVVRDFKTYVVSRINFKAAGWHHYIIDYVPFYNMRVDKIMNIDNWKSLSKEEQIAWSWVLVNETIDKNQETTNNYLRVKFEDLFSRNIEVRTETLAKIIDLYKVPLSVEDGLASLQKKHNPSLKKSVSSWDSIEDNVKEAVLKITEPLMKKYSYL